MFSTLINNRKASQDRTRLSDNGTNRQSASGNNLSTDRTWHPHRMSPTSHDGNRDTSYNTSSTLTRNDSSGSTSSAPWHASNPPQLPEEMRANEKLKQREQERNRQHRQSSRSSGKVSQDLAGKQSSNHMESSVTRLLVATKMLLEALTKWSLGHRTEEDVSDIYVRLGNDFNSAKLAFSSYGIDMTNLNSVPDDLRDCLELCLSEEASPPVLEIHLPRIREIIISLLQGLKMKQAEYKQFLVQQRAARDDKRQSRAVLQDFAVAEAPSKASAPPSSQTHPDGNSVHVSNRLSQTQHDAVSRSGQLARVSPAAASLPLDSVSTSHAMEPSDSPLSPNQSGKLVTRPPSRVTRAVSDNVPGRNSHSIPSDHITMSNSPSSAKGNDSASDGDLDDATPRLPSIERHVLTDTGSRPFATQEELSEASDQVQPTENVFSSPSAHRTPVRSPQHISRPSVETADGSDNDPSLRALKNREALERRASKRFSAYTFNKMGVGQSFSQGLGMNAFPTSATGSPLHDRKTVERRASGARRLPRHPVPDTSPSSESASPAPAGRSVDYFSSVGPPRSKSSATDNKIDAIQEISTPTSLSFPENDIVAERSSPKRSESLKDRDSEAGMGSSYAYARQSYKESTQPASSTDSLPFVDAQISNAELIAAPKHDSSALSSSLSTAPQSSRTQQFSTNEALNDTLPGTLNVFLQLGRQTRKAAIDLDLANKISRGITVAKLRMLFVDKFAYSPGMEDFPSIYVKDAGSGVAYELEELSDLEEGSLLTLNIEPLDQVKQHLDLSLGNITRELRELRTALTEKEREARRMSHGVVNNELVLASTVSQTPTQISDSQFQAAGQRVAQLKRANTNAANADLARKNERADEGSQPQSVSGGSLAQGSDTGSASGGNIAQELKVQFEEVQNLRREFAVTRQVQGDFETDVKLVLSMMRDQAAKVREIASTKVAAERNFIVAGKSKLDSNSQDLLTLIEDLQDTVDDLKMDVIQRGVKPRPALVKQIVEDIEKATNGLHGLEQYVQTVKPSWKKTWETELQNIVDEQEFLNHEEGLMSDLRDDLSGLTEVFNNIQQVVKLRGGSGKGGKYIPPLPEQGHEGLSTVMMEVKGQAVNHEKRLRALQAVERQRQKDLLTNKSQDEFTEELAGFVDKKVLRKTGGVLEAERVRQKRDHATWKAMFGGGGTGGAPLPSPSGVTLTAGTLDSGLEKPRKLVLGKKSPQPSK